MISWHYTQESMANTYECRNTRLLYVNVVDLYFTWLYVIVLNMLMWLILGPSWCGFCHSESIGCSTSYGVTNNWMRTPEFPKTSDNLESRYVNKLK